MYIRHIISLVYRLINSFNQKNIMAFDYGKEILEIKNPSKPKAILTFDKVNCK